MEMEELSALPKKEQIKNWRSFNKSDLSVDFVLAYEDNGNSVHKEKRAIFEKHLEEVGLIMERETNQKINFVKIHAPLEVLCQYAEILKLRMPIREDQVETGDGNILEGVFCKALDCCNIRLDKKKFPEQKYSLTATFSREKDYLFDFESEDFFTPSIRIAVISYILEREKFSEEEQDKGIKKLLTEYVYKAAYPLHDGDLFSEGSQRKLLYKEWASVSKLMKFQPINNIKEYFGVKIALYFTWLGFYTHMLIPAAIVGLLCMLYGVATLNRDTISQEICESKVIMCPLCDRNCDYWRLSDTCTYSKIVHIVDNPATIFFAIFMSIWSALYLELWKRYSAEIAHKWGLTDFSVQCEPPRPEYLTRLVNAKKRKLNIVTQLSEPVVPFWRVKLPSLIISFTVAIFWVLLAVAVVFGIVVYRMSLLASDTFYGDRTSYYVYLMPVTAGFLNLICIIILNYIYNILAEWLTEMELQRTQTEYDESLTLKIYMFQFVNYYSCIFYIAFLKGKFVGYPAKYNRFFDYRQEECNPGGCLLELTIQLTIIMIGNQFMNSVLEMVIPLVRKMYNSFKVTAGFKKANSEDTIITCNQWTEDYKLTDLEPQGLFREYLEMILQYGFVTIFVTAFPLAPLFALVNNVFEMRLDAKKIIKYYRRPVPQRVRDIGVWLPIMDILGRISVASNAFIIAFSSHFIPQLVFALSKEPRNKANGFLEFSLSVFNTKDFVNGTAPENSKFNVTTCRYPDFRHPPELEYKRPVEFWHILAARLAFIVVYQNVVGFVVSAVKWSIPDTPRKLNDQIKREAYRTNETIIKHETERAKAKLRKAMMRMQKSKSAISSAIKLNPDIGKSSTCRNRDSFLSNYSDVNSNGDIHSEQSSGLHNRNNVRNSVYHDIMDS